MEKKRIVVAMTGASGAILGIRLLQELRKSGAETHLIISDWARRTIELETDYTLEQVCAIADVVHPANDLAASVSSGSFQTDGMVIMPCCRCGPERAPPADCCAAGDAALLHPPAEHAVAFR